MHFVEVLCIQSVFSPSSQWLEVPVPVPHLDWAHCASCRILKQFALVVTSPQDHLVASACAFSGRPDAGRACVAAGRNEQRWLQQGSCQS